MNHSCWAWLDRAEWRIYDSAMDSLLESLTVPSNFQRYDKITEGDLLSRLGKWRNEAHLLLEELREFSNRNDLTLREKAQMVSTAAAFDGSGPWVSSQSLNV